MCFKVAKTQAHNAEWKKCIPKKSFDINQLDNTFKKVQYKTQ